MFGIIINSGGYKIDFAKLDENLKPEGYELNDGESIIATDWKIANSMIKPRWGDGVWTETASKEELDKLEEIRNPSKKPTDNDIIIANLMKANAEQQIINGQLMKEIAELKGGK